MYINLYKATKIGGFGEINSPQYGVELCRRAGTFFLASSKIIIKFLRRKSQQKKDELKTKTKESKGGKSCFEGDDRISHIYTQIFLNKDVQ